MKLRLSLIILSALSAQAYAETERVVVQAEVEMDTALPEELRKELQDELNNDVAALRRKYEAVEGVECSVVCDEEMEKSGCCGKPKPCCNKPCCCKDMELDQDQDSMDMNMDERCNCGKIKPRPKN